jgi:hypothetical protein
VRVCALSRRATLNACSTWEEATAAEGRQFRGAPEVERRQFYSGAYTVTVVCVCVCVYVCKLRVCAGAYGWSPAAKRTKDQGF